MQVGLIDADLMWGEHANGRRYGNSKADIFPNLALMKISAYHKQQGDNVSWYSGVEGMYDKVYISKVFSTTPDSRDIFQSKEVIFGGLGQTLTIRHDSLSRESFMPGIALAAKKVQGWKGLVEDLENIL